MPSFKVPTQLPGTEKLPTSIQGLLGALSSDSPDVSMFAGGAGSMLLPKVAGGMLPPTASAALKAKESLQHLRPTEAYDPWKGWHNIQKLLGI